jgi:hypothetical protein
MLPLLFNLKGDDVLALSEPKSATRLGEPELDPGPSSEAGAPARPRLAPIHDSAVSRVARGLCAHVDAGRHTCGRARDRCREEASMENSSVTWRDDLELAQAYDVGAVEEGRRAIERDPAPHGAPAFR